MLADAARVLDESNSPSRPLYLGYVGSTGLEVGVLAEALAATYDVNLAVTARAADLVEAQAVEWVAEFVGFDCAEGAFTSGGMISNLTALLVARERALPGCRVDGFGGRQGAVYCSSESHHSIVRAAEAAGIGSAFVRLIEIDEHRRLRVDGLERALAADRDAGVHPIAVVANGGTTLTGAVDPLDQIADVCERHSVWMHVDGAYGLPAAATDAPARCSRGSSAPTRPPSTPTSGSGCRRAAASYSCATRGCSRMPSATRSPTCTAATRWPTRSRRRSSTRARCAR